MSRSSAYIIVVSFLLVSLVCIGCRTDDSGEYVPIEIPALSTSAELTAALQDTNALIRDHASKRIENLWSGRTDFLISALDSEDRSVRRSASIALAKIGSEAAFSALRLTCLDSNLSFEKRFEAAMALGSAADQTALPILHGFQSVAEARSAVYGEYVEIGVSWILNPDSRKPLVVRGSGGVELRFLVDDIETVFYMDDSNVLSIGTQFIREFGNQNSERYEVPSQQFRTFCDLLQGGGLCPPKGIYCEFEEVRHLVIVLRDGLSVCLIRNEDMFMYSSEWNWISPRFEFCSPLLAEYLDGLRSIAVNVN